MSQQNNNEKTNYIDEHMLRKWFSASDDVVVHSHMFGKPPESVQAVYVYCMGMTDSGILNEIVFPGIRRVYEGTLFLRREDIDRAVNLKWGSLDVSRQGVDRQALATSVYAGYLLFCVPSLQMIWSLDVAKIPDRNPSESATEVSIRGPKDGFVENLHTNIALIRKRIRSASLVCEYFELGTRTLTTTALIYMEDIANRDMIKNIQHKLSSIKEDRLISVGQLEELLSPSAITLFPITDYTGRPDFAAECLLNGRFVILVNGNPTCIIAPINLYLMMKSPEDTYFPALSVNIGRILRFMGLLISVFLPSFYIALTAFHTDQIPYTLLATISSSRHGLPMDSGVEMFLIMGLMELFREAGVRLPSPIGQTLTVVGGLIIGDAAIRAGIVSPLLIVVMALTIVASSTLVNQVLTGASIVLRYASFFMATTLGMYGFILSFILFVIYLTSIESFGVPYLAPVAPLNLRQLFIGFFKVPFRWNKRRPDYLKTQEPKKKGNL